MKTIKATPNHKERTFTIRTYIDGKPLNKYRTIRLDREEFNSCLNNTENDWQQFLNKTSDYSAVN